MKNRKGLKIAIIVGICLLVLGSCVALQLKSAGFQRFKKNIQSEYSGGINRRIQIINANGEKVFELEGKFDFTYDSECIEYIDSKTNLKHNIFAGDNSTVIIDELEDEE